MKARFIMTIMSLATALAAVAGNKPAVIKGTVPRYQGKGYMIVFNEERTHTDTIKDIKPDGSFRAEINGMANSGAYLLYLEYLGDDAGSVQLYLSPGKTTEATVTGDYKMVPLLGRKYYVVTATFMGANVKECEYLNMPEYYDYKFKNDDGSPVSFQNYLDQIEEQRNIRRKALKGCKPQFIAKQGKEIDDMRKGMEFVYYRRLKLDGNDASQDKDFVRFVNSINMDTCPQELAVDNAWYQLAKDSTLYGGLPQKARLFMFLKDNIKDRQRLEQIADAQMNNTFAIGDNTDIVEVFKIYQQCSDTSALYNENLQKYKSLSTLMPGVKASDFVLKDSDGNDVHFLDVIGHGKATYIDFWATWCGPCVSEIPFVEKKVEQYKDNPNIRFVSISLDQNISKWRAKIDRDKPCWAQYVIPDNFNSDFAKQYNVNAIPRFMFFDKNGCIITINAPRPSDNSAFESMVADYVK